MLKVVKKRNILYIISGVVLAAGIISMIFFPPILGIDFKGGSMAEVKFLEEVPEPVAVMNALADFNLPHTVVQRTDEDSMTLRMREITPEEHQALIAHLSGEFGEIEQLRFTQIGPTLSREITRRAQYQLVLVALGILLFIAWAFRSVPKPLSSWRFGWAAIIALLHDLLIVIGVFAILGRLLNIEIDTLFITALLTVLGFSVNDTIIIFDRIRENLKRLSGLPFDQVVDRSINQTIVRSINTSSTVMFVLLALLLFGGETIRYFVLALMVGVAAGTYSSIFIASPLLYEFHKKKFAP